MKIKFQADADFNQTIIHALQRCEPAIEFRTADEAQIRGLPDPEVLTAAAREGRILVSHDHHTMPVHFANFIATQQSPGVFLLSQTVKDGPILLPSRLFLFHHHPYDEGQQFLQRLEVCCLSRNRSQPVILSPS